MSRLFLQGLAAVGEQVVKRATTIQGTPAHLGLIHLVDALSKRQRKSLTLRQQQQKQEHEQEFVPDSADSHSTSPASDSGAVVGDTLGSNVSERKSSANHDVSEPEQPIVDITEATAERHTSSATSTTGLSSLGEKHNASDTNGLPTATASLTPQEALSTSSRPFRKEIHKQSRERAVPSSRVGRVWQFSSLGMGLGWGALSELGRRTLGSEGAGSVFLTESNLNRVVATLCRVRGAALKLGQMISIQDESFLPGQFAAIFERVRESADFMPTYQMSRVMEAELGPEWRSKFKEFSDRPFAAASIGQVHYATLDDGREVAVKVQYPGVAESIDSDIENLRMILNFTGILPKGLFVDNVLRAARTELRWECDYEREADSYRAFRALLQDHPFFGVPGVVDELTTKRVLTTELAHGDTLDAVTEFDQGTRDKVARGLLELSLREAFEWKLMQTDANWANFLYDRHNEKLNLIDFGATHSYKDSFIKHYIEIIDSAARGDRQRCQEASVAAGFLAPDDTKQMVDAHVSAVMMIAQPFAKEGSFDFGKQDVTAKVRELIPIMLRHRKQPPPIETYSLHRKLSGVFLVCARLRANIECKSLFDDVYAFYHSRKPSSQE